MESTQKSLPVLEDTWAALAADVYNQHTSFVKRPLDNMQRDVAYVKFRCSREGLSFLTKTLPQLGKALDRALETGVFLRPRPFKRWKKHAEVPKFLRPLFSLVFSQEGYLRPDADPYVIADLRTLLFFFYKLEGAHSEKSELEAVEGLVSREAEIAQLELSPSTGRVANLLMRQYLDGFDPMDIYPRHGPGAVADKSTKASEKCKFSTFYSGLNTLYPYSEYFGLDSWALTELMSRSSPGARPTSRVVTVPKDSRGPRVISCEPLEYQYIQQGIMRKLYTYIESHPYTEGRVNFADQSVNGELAKRSSVTREYSTLDLSEASDRVSLQLVMRLFAGTSLEQPLLRTRSIATELPDGRIISLKKFAPMGSALCFPIESLVFFFLIKGRLHELQLDDADAVYVYGDDIIIRTDLSSIAIQALEDAGLRVNLEKSFTEGFFRESCGVDAFKGVVVTPLRLRKVARRAGEHENIVGLVDSANALFERCYYKASNVLKRYVEKLLRTSLPYSRSKQGFLSWVDPRSRSLTLRGKVKWNKDLCRYDISVIGYRDRTHLIEYDLDEGERAEYHRKLTQGFSPEYEAARYPDRKPRLQRIWLPLSVVATKS